jgi:fructose-1,6-bisphosphatase
MASLASACQHISGLVRRANVDGMAGLATAGPSGAVEVNVQGEEQKRLDVVTNDLLKTWLCSSGSLYCVASEEEAGPCTCRSVVGNLAAFDGDLVAMFDPLDGSSNVDSGLATGTIFAVLRQPKHLPDVGPHTLLQPGAQLVAAGYCLYGASTTLVCSLGAGVQGFTLDEAKGKFVLTHPDLRIPKRGAAVMFNLANFDTWDPGVQRYVTAAQTEAFRARVAADDAAAAAFAGAAASLAAAAGAAAAAPTGAAAAAAARAAAASSFTARDAGRCATKPPPEEAAGPAAAGPSKAPRARSFKYSGAFVGDVHALLTRGGGLFGYPADARNPDGKLRLLYESNPMAFLVEQAGGAATTGRGQRILAVQPSAVHQRVPTFMGSVDDVNDLVACMANPDA